MTVNNKLSIIIPYIRPEGFEKCISKLKGDNFEIIAEEDKERIGVAKMVKKLLKKTKYDLIVFLGDDTEPDKDMLKNALKAMKKFPDGIGLVGINDGTHNDSHAPHFMIHRKMIDMIGGEIFHTGYYHCFCDDELILRAKLLDRFKYEFTSKLIHNNPMVNEKIKPDDDYNRVYSKDNFLKDKLLWKERKAKILFNFYYETN